MAKRGRTKLTEAEQAAMDALLGDRQTGVLRVDLVAAIAESLRIRRENTRNGDAMFKALHRDSGSWRTVSYLTGVNRMTASRYGDRVIPDDV